MKRGCVGWLHAGAAPLAWSPGSSWSRWPRPLGRLGGASSGRLCTAGLGTSGLYHRGTWSPRAGASCAGWTTTTSTASSPRPTLRWPCCCSPAPPECCCSAWLGAALGGLIFWLSAPLWLYTALYIVMGWAELGWLGSFYANGGPAVLIMILAGGLLHHRGGGLWSAPAQPVPAWFGFHEIFHARHAGRLRLSLRRHLAGHLRSHRLGQLIARSSTEVTAVGRRTRGTRMRWVGRHARPVGQQREPG